MVVLGDTDKLVELLLEGYDHILDVRESSENGIVEVAAARGLTATVNFLNSIEDFEVRFIWYQRACVKQRQLRKFQRWNSLPRVFYHCYSLIFPKS